ncbi:MAG: hypothetical protein ABI629_00990 [bacterium]
MPEKCPALERTELLSSVLAPARMRAKASGVFVARGFAATRNRFV